MSQDPYPARQPCLFEDCNISTEEHHRINRGMSAELATLRARLRQPEALDLSTIPAVDLLAELARRLQNSGKDTL